MYSSYSSIDVLYRSGIHYPAVCMALLCSRKRNFWLVLALPYYILRLLYQYSMRTENGVSHVQFRSPPSSPAPSRAPLILAKLVPHYTTLHEVHLVFHPKYGYGLMLSISRVGIRVVVNTYP